MVNASAPMTGPEGLPRVPASMPGGPQGAPPPSVAAPKLNPVDLRPFEIPDELQRQAEQKGHHEPPAEQKVDRNDAKKQVETLNKVMDGLGHRLSFGLYEETNQLFVKLVDRNSNKVVKVLPPKYLLDLHAKLQKALGVVIDEEV